MNSTVSSTQNGSRYVECHFAFFSQLLRRPFLPTSVQVVLVFTIVVQLSTCSFTILLNALVIVGVNTKRRLKTKANILLACLASTEVSVGLLVQPCHVAMEMILLLPSSNISTTNFCALTDALGWFFDIFCTASLYHLVLISGERYAALKHPIWHNRSVTNTRLVMSSVTAWLIALVTCFSFTSDIFFALGNALRGICVLLIFSFCVVVYRVVRRYKKQAIGQQLSNEVKKNIFNEIKIVKTTMAISVIAFICYVPTMVFFMVTGQAGVEGFSPENSCIFLILATLLTILNSLFNPLIHTVRGRRFRVAFIEMLTRRRFHQAKRIEELLFGVRRRLQQNIAEGNGDCLRNNRIDKPNNAALQIIELRERICDKRVA